MNCQSAKCDDEKWELYREYDALRKITKRPRNIRDMSPTRNAERTYSKKGELYLLKSEKKIPLEAEIWPYAIAVVEDWVKSGSTWEATIRVKVKLDSTKISKRLLQAGFTKVALRGKCLE
jgi:hypothetical protein